MGYRDAIDILESYNRAIADLEDKAVDRLDKALARSFLQLERELRAKLPGIRSNATLLSAQRQALILRELGELLILIQPDRKHIWTKLFKDLIVESDRLGGELVSETIMAIAPNEDIANFAALDLESAAKVAETTWDSLFLYSDKFRTDATAIISTGVANGYGAAKIASLLRERLKLTKFQANRIARTETIKAVSDSARKRFKNSGATGYTRIAIGDSRVCVYCAARAGKSYPIDNPMVLHPFDRCYPLFWSKEWVDDGLVDVEFLKGHRKEVLDALRDAGKQPNYGKAPFELETPKPIWEP